MSTAMALTAGAELTIVHASAQHAEWLAATASLDADGGADGGVLSLDLSAVSEIDSAGLQLLLALRASLAERGRALRLQSPNAMVLEALRTLGLQALFMSPDATA